MYWRASTTTYLEYKLDESFKRKERIQKNE